MGNFRNEILDLGYDITFDLVRDCAVRQLSVYSLNKLDSLYNDLERGKGILDGDDHLNMYLKCFGKMHKAKLFAAFESTGIIDCLLKEPWEIEIYDWGCGQGTATICLLDYINEKGFSPKILRVNLIDPSEKALERARFVLSKYELLYDVEIKITAKKFDDLTVDDIEDIDGNEVRKIHLFSNILDVTTFDLADFTHLFQKSQIGYNLIICVGPYYSNNQRMNDFIEAINPDAKYVTFERGRGQWLKEWTISLRVVGYKVKNIELPEDIRKRITESQKRKQLFAGYILDWVDGTLKGSEYEELSKPLMRMLAAFDVTSDVPMELPEDIDPVLAVMNNIITRGLPTRASEYIEKIFCNSFKFSESNKSDYVIEYKGKGKATALEVFEALHVIDPRFSTSDYNKDILESSFEKSFITGILNKTDSTYLTQVLEPQRWLSSIIRLPDNNFGKDQRVDFALQIPYLDDGINSLAGFIVEIDGKPYHSDIITHIKDTIRNGAAQKNNWDTYRLTESNNISFVQNWEQENRYSCYLQTLRKNYERRLEGEWKDIIQSVLSPFAIARMEVLLIQAMITGRLNMDSPRWDIVVIERDVPCAALAIEELKKMYENLSSLKGEKKELPEINLTIISNKEFADSPLHGANRPLLKERKNHVYDLCIDISMLLRDKIDCYPIESKSKTYYVVRSAHYQKVQKTILTSENIEYLPLVSKTKKGEYVEISAAKEKLKYFLNNIFRKKDFRPGQLPILSRILSNKTTIGLLPTGGGKSLTYQLASMLQPGVTIVVDPLISLMVDQYNGLMGNRIDACACVNSTLTREERSKNLGKLQNGELQFILLSPERFMMEEFRNSLCTMSDKNHVYFAYGVIDEVHCVSEWGHDFRPAYLQLGKNMTDFMTTKASVMNLNGGNIPIVGLTATASFDVLADVERELTLGGRLSVDSDTIVRPEMEQRKELTYKIVPVRTDFSAMMNDEEPYVLRAYSEREIKEAVITAKKAKILEILDEVPKDLCEINLTNRDTAIKDFYPDLFYEKGDDELYQNAGIVFCPHAKGTFGVKDSVFSLSIRPGIASFLHENCMDMEIGTFVGGDSPDGDMQAFKENRQNLMVATKAFGMGIDKPNVRYTINVNHPSSIEDYVQAAGRGGRDRKNAISYVLFDSTEYIELSINNIIDILTKCELGQQINWLWNYRDKFVLAEDFIELCKQNGCSEREAKAVKDSAQPYFENVDRNIELFFHNNSFRGTYKEKLMLYEMTYNIMNVQTRNIMAVQERLREEVGDEEITLKLNNDRNSIVVLSEGGNKQYGYLLLEGLRDTYRYSDYPIEKSTFVLSVLKDILSEYPDFSANWLNKPQTGLKTDEGIYKAMDKIDKDGYTYVTVTWTNQIDTDPEEYKKKIIKTANEIADRYGWNRIDEVRYGNMRLENINDFISLLNEISKKSNDSNWLIYHANEELYKPLKRLFWSKRDKDDTDKAIYRLSCIGLVEDVTIDYLSQTYSLKIKKRNEGEYYHHLQRFFEKYYSPERAAQKMVEVRNYRSKTEIDKCIGYLTGFVYDTLAKKRRRAIDDMRYACYEGIGNGVESLKEFILLYFNSKYNRKGYEINGENYSLSDDVNTDKRNDVELVEKYIEAIRIDDSGSEVDNVKHLYGAVLINLRDHTDNFSLHLLRAYCLAFLGTGENEVLLNDFKTSLLNEGFKQMINIYETEMIFAFFDKYIRIIKEICHDEWINDYLKEVRSKLSLAIYGSWFIDFAEEYTKQ